MFMPENKEMHTEKQKKNKEKKGFYAALAICVAAVGIAAWSTYDTVTDFLEPANTGTDTLKAASQTAVEKDDPESAVDEGHGHGSAVSRAEVQPERTEVKKPESAAKEQAVSSAAEKAEAAQTQPEAQPAEEAAAKPEYKVSPQFLRPVGSDTVVKPYSEVPVYSETMRDYRAHLGADYVAERGETVKAAANGVVKETYTDMLLGNTIVVEHGDITLRYCGLGSTFLVKPGEIVAAGQDIGSVTAAPFESLLSVHLHLEAEENGIPVDPESLFN